MHPTMHPIVRLAKETIEDFTRDKKAPGKVTLPDDLPPEFTTDRAGVFVSLKIDGQLRGCIGTFEPLTPNIVEEVVRNAVAASTKDPRFPPVDESELSLLSFSVDVLTTPEPVEDMSGLDPKRYGVIVRSGQKRGLLLPDLDGVNTVRKQLEIAMMKAGISADDEDLRIERFEVKRYR